MDRDALSGLIIVAVIAVIFVLLLLGLRAARRRRRAELAEPELVGLEAREAEELAPPAEGAPEVEELEGEVAPPVAEEAAAEELAPRRAEDAVLAEGLARTRSSFLGRLEQLFGRSAKVDPALLDELEEVLLTSDVGVALTGRMVEELRGDLEARRLESPAAVRGALKARMLGAFTTSDGRADPLHLTADKPRVILFVGVNGVGKTTTIGKIAAQLHERGQSVVLAAGDTFRAAAAEQLTIWAERTGSKIIRGEEGADPASVVFNAIEHAKTAGADFVLADTAGRLHTKTELMDEIKKVKRACTKARVGAPDETWLVVDATTGQNALQQAREFHQALELSGVILTKLDGTAKGGVVIAIADALHLPVRFVGVGEKASDLRPFDANVFVDALFRPA